MSITNTYDPNKIYLTLKQFDGYFALADQHGRQLAWCRDMKLNLSPENIASCDVTVILSKPGCGIPEKYVNKQSSK